MKVLAVTMSQKEKDDIERIQRKMSYEADKHITYREVMKNLMKLYWDTEELRLKYEEDLYDLQ